MLEKKRNKSQAALEFLTTYGWAFLIIIIMIGVLAYFGVLSPSKLLPNRCNFGPEFSCLSYQISATDSTFKLRLKNGLAEPINVELISLSTEGATAYSGCTPSGFSIPFNSWKAGNTTDFVWTGCTGGGLVAGEKGKVLVTIRYHPVLSGDAYSSEVKGEVFSSVI
ncbi:hypothetical protein HYX05_04085 [Candidatus Woesearchaeota archaeon]|nr:hypothetical protein [Candidatus Woesearchaeota archaeon]